MAISGAMEAAGPAAADRSAGDAVYRRIVARLLPLLMICYVLNYLDRSNIGFAKLEFQGDIGLSEAAFGLGAGLFYIGYSVFEIPSNMMLQRIGARLTLLRIMLGWGVCATLFSVMQTPMHYYILRFVLGVTEAGFFPGVLLLISFWIPARRRAGFTAMFMSAMAISGIIGGPLSGFVMHGMDGTLGWEGWRWMFLIEGLPSIAMGIVVYRMLADTPEQASWLTDEQKRVLAAEFSAERDAARSGPAAHHDFRAVIADWRIYTIGAMSIAMIASSAGLQFWLPTIVRQSGVTDVLHVGLLCALPFIVAIAVQQWVARRSDRTDERRWHAATCAFISAAGWLLLTVADRSLIPALFAATLIAGGFFGATGPFWALPSRYLTGSAAAGGLALIAMLGGVGSFASPTIVGWLATLFGSLKPGYLYYGALMTVGPCIMLWGTALMDRRRTAG